MDIIYNMPNSKKSNSKIRGKNSLELDEWFVYLLDGEKIYYKTYQEIGFLNSVHKEAKYLGIGRPNQPVHKPNFPTTYLSLELKEAMGYPIVKEKHHKNTGLICCYCEVDLVVTTGFQFSNTKTKDHIIPKSKGGTDAKENLRFCCYECNQQKGSLTLPQYIMKLNYSLDGVLSGPLFEKIQVKIKNANKIAKELGLSEDRL